MNDSGRDLRFAVLIDADNVSYRYVQGILSETVNFGVPTYKRIYGDWTQPSMAEWKKVLLEHSITPMQQYSYTTGKNATDSALIIDAMDILYSGSVDGFCIVSSDSDFTRLAARLREASMFVVGMGETKTPKPFVAACERFIYLENVLKASALEQAEQAEKIAGNKQDNAILPLEILIHAIQEIIEEQSDNSGWIFLGTLGGILSKRFPDFDSRNYGYAKLLPLIESTGAFIIQERKTNNPHVVHPYLKNSEDF